MLRLFFALTFCILCCALAPLSAQEPVEGEPHFTDAVEVLSVETQPSTIPQGEEKVQYDGLVLSTRIIRDDEHRAIRTTDGKVYPWPDAFDRVVVDIAYNFPATLIYKGNVFLQSFASNNQQATTYWTLNLATGVYTKRAANTVSTFCGEIAPSELIKEWVVKIDEREARLCSPYRRITSSPLPNNYRWLNYDTPPTAIITVSPSKNTLVFVGYVDQQYGYDHIFFRYDIREDKTTIVGTGSMYHNSGINVQWLTDDIVVFTTSNSGAYMTYAPVLNVIDLRYNDVTVIQGATLYTQDNQINVSHDPPKITVSDIIYVNLQTGDTSVKHTYCRDTIYDILNRVKQQIDYGEFCNFVGGQQLGVRYYLSNGQLWRYQSGEMPTAYLIVNEHIEHVQLWDDNLLIYTHNQVLQLDTTAVKATPEVFFDHPALELVESASSVTPSNPFHYFITTEGLLRVNVKTDEQVLLFKGQISEVKWIDVDQGFAALVYQLIEKNFPPYIPPTIEDVTPFDQPDYTKGKSALVNLKTGKVIFETDIEWEKQRELYPGYWKNADITDWGHGWFQWAGSKTIYIVSPEGKVVDTVETTEEFMQILRVDDWLLFQTYPSQTLSLVNPATRKTILLGTDISFFSSDIRYQGNGQFSLALSNGKIYHIRVSQLQN